MIIVFMGKKELLKQLIAGFQASLPVEVCPREFSIPVDSGKIITVPGVRRCGKSSLFLLAINQLIREQIVTKEQILFLNFDDERLKMNADNLDEILQAYRELYPAISLKDVYMFFDEVQMADDWQPFVRRVYEQECRHIFLTGSNSRMLSSELATSLRGRTLQYEEFPLSFNEFCDFTGIDTNRYVPESRAKLVNAFKVYLHGGGFPEVVLAAPLYKDRILQEYFFVMLYKDLVERYEIKNPEPIRYFIKRVMSNLTKPTSINRIYNELKSQGVSIGKNTLYDVIVQTESIYLFFSLTKYEPSLVKENTGDKKYYCIDNGLRSVLLNPQSEDNGKLLENAVFLHLRRSLRIQEELHYYKGKKECDFVVTEFDKVTRLIQVSYQMSDEETRKREIDGLLEAAKVTGCRELTIITMETEAEWNEQDMLIRVLPAWKWMLE
ncbi:ATP-binding protein [Bacteroides faecium]|nr:ATP-binding protein [Bacteroides faecium]